MICILSNMTMEIIKFDVISAKYYSIECDEVTSHKWAYMSVIVRYVYDYRICERCIKLHRVSNLTGKSLADVIIAILANMNFPICNLVGKGFDGASSMSGKDEGVQQHLTVAGADKSTYFHCFAHKLNLVLEKSVKNVPYVNDVFDTLAASVVISKGLRRGTHCMKRNYKFMTYRRERWHCTHFQTQDGLLDLTTWMLFSTLFLPSSPCSKQCLKRVNQLQMDCSYVCKSSSSLHRVLY